MIARAASPTLSADKSSTINFNRATIRSCGSGSPITPVDDENTRSDVVPRTSAAAPVTAATDFSPLLPVKAFALPEFTTIPILPDAGPFRRPSLAWQSSTGAARVDDRVNTPAMVLPASASASITSVRLAYFTPADAAQNRTPEITGKSGKPPLGASGDTAGPLAAVSASANLRFSFLTFF